MFTPSRSVEVTYIANLIRLLYSILTLKFGVSLRLDVMRDQFAIAQRELTRRVKGEVSHRPIGLSDCEPGSRNTERGTVIVHQHK